MYISSILYISFVRLYCTCVSFHMLSGHVNHMLTGHVNHMLTGHVNHMLTGHVNLVKYSLSKLYLKVSVC